MNFWKRFPAELLVALAVMTLATLLIVLGVNGEIKSVFVIGATLAIRSGFILTQKSNNKKADGEM